MILVVPLREASRTLTQRTQLLRHTKGETKNAEHLLHLQST
jgi:hypothetical protein